MHVTALVEVEQAAGCRDQNVAVARFELLELFVEVHATDEGHDVEIGVLGQRRGVFGDLHHQFAGRRDDQCARFAHVAFFRRRCLRQLGDDRDQERGGLAGTGLRATDGVLAGEGETQHLRLDRRAVREAQILDGVHQFWSEREVVKAGLAFLGFDDEIFEFPRSDDGLGAVRDVGVAFRRVSCAEARRRWALAERFPGISFGRASTEAGRSAWEHRAMTGGVRRRTGNWRELLSLAFTEHFFKCFEHGHLVD